MTNNPELLRLEAAGDRLYEAINSIVRRETKPSKVQNVETPLPDGEPPHE